MTSTSRKKLARPTTRKPDENADPVGLFPKLSEKLKEAYQAQLRAFLRRNLLVEGLAPAVRQSIFAAVTARGQPVSADFRIPSYPADAFGFFPADGEVMTPVAELATEVQRDEQSDDPEYVDVEGLFRQDRAHAPTQAGLAKSAPSQIGSRSQNECG
jgi:hypothetical protein